MSIADKLKQNAFTKNEVVKTVPVHELPQAELLDKVKVTQVKNKEGNVVLSMKIGIFPVKSAIYGQDKTVVAEDEVEEAVKALLELVRTPEGIAAVEKTREAIKVSAEKRAAKLAENKANPTPKVAKKTREVATAKDLQKMLDTEE